MDCLLVSPPKGTTSPNFTEKTFANSHKTWRLANVFSLESFLLYSHMTYQLQGSKQSLCLSCDLSTEGDKYIKYGQEF